jgi:hypothetical protein
MEARELLTGGAGFLTGSVLLDGASGAPMSGVTVQLFSSSDLSTPVATVSTDANGQYLFTGLAPGDYVLKDVVPTGYTANGASASSQLNPATVVDDGTIQVTVVDPTKVYVNYGGATQFEGLRLLVKGQSSVNAVGPMRDTLGTSAGATDLNPGFVTLCVDQEQSLSSTTGGDMYRVVPQPITALTDGVSTISADHAGRIAYLFNHYAADPSLTNVQGAGLQLAIWELLYDPGDTPDFSAGAFQAVSGVSPYTSPETFTQIIAQATAYFNDSTGKSETAVFLDAAAANPGVTEGLQSVLCTESLNFGLTRVTDLTRGETATIGFWHNKNGQALIKSFNGGPTSTDLATWLATSFPNLYGPGTTATNPYDLTGKTNADVASLFLTFFKAKGMKTNAQLLAVALAEYATTSSLGATAAAKYGFVVTDTGVGSAGFNVGSSGAAFGVANNTVLTVAQILASANRGSTNGLLYGGDTSLITLANSVLDGINQKGDIG